MAFHFELCNRRIYVAGHTGMVGKAIVRALKPYLERETSPPSTLITRTSQELDLRKSWEVDDFFLLEQPDIVLFAAARVGGIGANAADPAGFLHDNALMAINAVEKGVAARRQAVCVPGQ
jgi:GDP-L-fucose synthase